MGALLIHAPLGFVLDLDLDTVVSWVFGCWLGVWVGWVGVGWVGFGVWAGWAGVWVACTCSRGTLLVHAPLGFVLDLDLNTVVS